MKKEQLISFGDLAVEKRKIKSEFFNQINKLIDWRLISNIINKHYSKGESVSGAPSYDGLLLFKMSLLQTWYGLSDYEVEDQVNDRISFSRFVGLSMDQKSPDHSVLSRFRTHMTEKNAYEKLFKALNKQLVKHGIIIKTGAMIDASVTSTPLCPKGSKEYEIVQDRAEEPRSEEEIAKEEASFKFIQKTQPGVDREARWLKKGKKLYYGYKQHVVTETQGMILGVLTTTANVNEISNLQEVLAAAELPERIPVFADKGYASEANRKQLFKMKLADRIQRKAPKGKSLKSWEKKLNKIIGKTRYKIERVFGSIKRWFSAGLARYRGLAKMHTQHLLQATAYNLYRAPGILMSKNEKLSVAISSTPIKNK